MRSCSRLGRPDQNSIDGRDDLVAAPEGRSRHLAGEVSASSRASRSARSIGARLRRGVRAELASARAGGEVRVGLRLRELDRLALDPHRPVHRRPVVRQRHARVGGDLLRLRRLVVGVEAERSAHQHDPPAARGRAQHRRVRLLDAGLGVPAREGGDRVRPEPGRSASRRSPRAWAMMLAGARPLLDWIDERLAAAEARATGAPDRVPRARLGGRSAACRPITERRG